jgi:hypothetical protein
MISWGSVNRKRLLSDCFLGVVGGSFAVSNDTLIDLLTLIQVIDPRWVHTPLIGAEHQSEHTSQKIIPETSNAVGTAETTVIMRMIKLKLIVSDHDHK